MAGIGRAGAPDAMTNNQFGVGQPVRPQIRPIADPGRVDATGPRIRPQVDLGFAPRIDPRLAQQDAIRRNALFGSFVPDNPRSRSVMDALQRPEVREAFMRQAAQRGPTRR